MGWYETSKFEKHLHSTLHRRGGDADSHRQAAEHGGLGVGGGSGGEEGGLDSSDGPLRSSQRCAAHLEATGLLGRKAAAGAEGSALADAATATEGAAAAAAVAGFAAEGLGFLQARRRLYESMEASLLHKGLALGG